MNLNPYRSALALPGVRSLLLVSLLARIPLAASALALTFHVVLHLDRGYGAAGLVATALTVGSAVGSPWLGRLVDRYGLRPVVALTTVAEGIFWATVPMLSFELLLPAAFLCGLLNLPVYSVVRQSIAALVPADQRRPAYALDSMAVELSFMVGPALLVAVAAALTSTTTLYLVGAGIVAAGILLFVLDPPTRDVHEREDAGRAVPRREWLNRRLLGVLALSTATTVVVGGTDVAVVAALRAVDQLDWTGVAVSLWAGASLVGGFAYGSVRRPWTPVALVAAMSLATVPVGLGGGSWWLLCLALVPAGLLCAPSIAASADAVSRLAPARVRGEAMGLHGSALTVGVALGAPLAGAVIDVSSPSWGFAVPGLLGALVAGLVWIVTVHRQRSAASPAATMPASTEPSEPVHPA